MIVYGKQVFFYILKYHKDLISELYLAKECDKESFNIIKKSNIKIKKLDFISAQALARGGNHQGFLLNIKEYQFSTLQDLKKEKFLVMLYGITDLGNIGSIIRSAYALGITGLIFIGQKLKMQNVIRTSSGAALDMNIALSPEPFDILNELKQQDFKIYASGIIGENYKQINFDKNKQVLIMGSEGYGLPNKILKKCDKIISIKMQNDFDSLNVGVAFALLADRMLEA